MIGILMATHEDLGSSLLKSARLIVGEQEDVRTLSLGRGDDIQEFKEKVGQAIKELREASDVLVLTDLFGGSPSNAAACNLEQYQFRCLSGVNLPMLLEALLSRNTDHMNIDRLAEKCLDSGREGIKDIGGGLRTRQNGGTANL